MTTVAEYSQPIRGFAIARPFAEVREDRIQIKEQQTIVQPWLSPGLQETSP